MEQTPRKATDVLLDLETKLNQILDIIKTQDLNIKIISNKLNDLITKVGTSFTNQKITVEAVQPPLPQISNFPAGFHQIPSGDTEKNILISSENNIPIDNSPSGFRRNSRPETFTNQAPVQLPKIIEPAVAQQKNKMQAPPGRKDEPVIINNSMTIQSQNNLNQDVIHETSSIHVPTMQRIVDKNGKSVFLADVEIINLSTSEVIFKNRTNGAGKWTAPLPVGQYRVFIKKRGNDLKKSLEATQDVQVDGSKNPLELPMIIIK